MKLKATWVFIFIPFGVILLSQGDRMKATVDQGSVISTEQSTASGQSRLLREQAQNAQRYSKVAIERLKANCLPVVDQQSGSEGYFKEGSVVMDHSLGRPVRAGAFVCNSLGDTAVVGADGTLTEIVRASLEKQGEYDELFNKLLKGQVDGKSSK
jgi:hypothetical protein